MEKKMNVNSGEISECPQLSKMFISGLHNYKRAQLVLIPDQHLFRADSVSNM